MANKNKTVTVPDQILATLDFLDKQEREYKYLARLMSEEMIRSYGAILQKEAPDLFEKYKKGFVTIEIDWKAKQLVVIPTADPKKKGEEVAEALTNHAKSKNSN